MITKASDVDSFFHMGVEITWDCESSRAARLQSALETADEIGRLSGHPRVVQKVFSLHDHEGHMTVTWHAAPNDLEKSILDLAWAGEHEYSTDHKVSD